VIYHSVNGGTPHAVLHAILLARFAAAYVRHNDQINSTILIFWKLLH
jgi:hypothetical protein